MSKTNGESENYTTIKAAKQENTYLEDVSGDQAIEEPKKTTCHICGLTARNQEELQDHIKNAHREPESQGQ